MYRMAIRLSCENLQAKTYKDCAHATFLSFERRKVQTKKKILYHQHFWGQLQSGASQ